MRITDTQRHGERRKDATKTIFWYACPPSWLRNDPNSRYVARQAENIVQDRIEPATKIKFPDAVEQSPM